MSEKSLNPIKKLATLPAEMETGMYVGVEFPEFLVFHLDERGREVKLPAIHIMQRHEGTSDCNAN